MAAEGFNAGLAFPGSDTTEDCWANAAWFRIKKATSKPVPSFKDQLEKKEYIDYIQYVKLKGALK